MRRSFSPKIDSLKQILVPELMKSNSAGEVHSVNVPISLRRLRGTDPFKMLVESS